MSRLFLVQMADGQCNEHVFSPQAKMVYDGGQIVVPKVVSSLKECLYSSFFSYKSTTLFRVLCRGFFLGCSLLIPVFGLYLCGQYDSSNNVASIPPGQRKYKGIE